MPFPVSYYHLLSLSRLNIKVYLFSIYNINIYRFIVEERSKKTEKKKPRVIHALGKWNKHKY